MAKYLVVNLYKYGQVTVPSMFDQFDFDDFKIVSYLDAARALNINIPPQNMGFFEVSGSIVLDKYVSDYEKLFNPELIIKNSLCGTFMNHETPMISVIANNYIREPEIMFKNKFLDSFNYWRQRYGFVFLQKTNLYRKKGFEVVAISKQIAEDYKKEFGVECKIIENGVDIDKFKPMDKERLKEKYGVPKDKKVGVWCGSFIPNNWHFMPKLIKEFKDIFWVLIFKHRTNYKPRSKNVKIFGPVKHETMPELLNLGDFFIDPSFYNSFGLINLEAMACDIPIITSKTGIFFDWQSRDCGYIITKQEYERYKKAVEDVIKEENEYFPRDVLIQEKLTLRRFQEDWKTLIEQTVK